VEVIETGHRILPHTADLIIEAWAPTREECLAQAVRALVDTFADTSGAPAAIPLPFTLDPAGDEELLVALLEEVLFILDVMDMVPVNVVVEPTEDGGLAGSLDVAPVEQILVTGAAPKAVARQLPRVGRQDGLWVCQAAIDV
jgi:SHS2 domain-containing protein